VLKTTNSDHIHHDKISLTTFHPYADLEKIEYNLKKGTNFPLRSRAFWCLLLALCLGLLHTLGSKALAQQTPPPQSDLGALSGLTESQAITARGIQEVWARLFGLREQLDEAQKDMFDRCRELVQTSNFLQGVGPTEFRVEKIETAEELASAIQEVSQVKLISLKTGAIESASGQFTNIAARLRAIRLGVTGITLAGFTPPPYSTAEHTASSTLPQGGGASADGEQFSRLGGFVNGSFVTGDRDETDREEAFDFDSGGLTAGVDYRFSNNLVAGLAIGYASTDVDLEDSGGNSEIDTYSIFSYTTYYIDDFYVDAVASFAWNDYGNTRRILYPNVTRTATSETDGRQYAIGLGMGYDSMFSNWRISPLTRLQYVNVDLDEFEETNSFGLDLAIGDQRIESLLSTLGATASYAVSTQVGVFSPQLRMEWQHEFLNDSRNVKAIYTNDPNQIPWSIPTDDPDRDYFTLGVGAASTFKRGISAFIDYQTIVGLDVTTAHLVNAGVRMEF
jgi:outer membrane lipase/esterase